MLPNTVRKSRIELDDYDYQEDIQKRLKLATFSVMDIAVLEEILHSSLCFSVESLLEQLDLSFEECGPSLDKIAESGLIVVQDGRIFVDKAMRKFYEFEIEKFDPSFSPDLEFVQALLRKVPIHILPNWYSLPKVTDDIFIAIIERCLKTPKIFQRYLREVEEDFPLLHRMAMDVFSSPELKRTAAWLCDRYNLTREQFEKEMLLLELHFMCALSYERVGDRWEEVVTPLTEWKEFLKERNRRLPHPVNEEDVRKGYYSRPFAFIEDLSALLVAMEQKELPLTEESGKVMLSYDFVVSWLPKLRQDSSIDVSRYLDLLVRRLLELHLTIVSNGILRITQSGRNWLKTPLQERAMMLHRHPTSLDPFSHFYPLPLIEKGVRAVEKSFRLLKRDQGWFLVDPFIEQLIVPVGTIEPVHLEKKGKKWRYLFPVYGEREKEFIKLAILERAFQSGMVVLASCQGAICFQLTPFGELSCCE